MVKQFHAKTGNNVLPHSLYSTDLAPCNFYQLSEKTFSGTPFCDIGKGKSSIGGDHTGGCEKWLPIVLPEVIRKLTKSFSLFFTITSPYHWRKNKFTNSNLHKEDFETTMNVGKNCLQIHMIFNFVT
ncbi:hypothetical protein TNCV_1201481 [Trichonephila clavipes]|nr:hypothetical protein TNCV_1201481 [Trichonephila clavipes]